MDQAERSNSAYRKRWYLFIGLLAFLLSMPLCLYLYFTQLPYKLKSVLKSPSLSQFVELYRDLNHDGITEAIEIGKSPGESIYKIIVMKENRSTFDQFNFGEYVSRETLIFGDYTGDGFDELFVFSRNTDSLFLSIVDPLNKKWILKRHFLIKAPQYKPSGEWDVRFVRGSLVDPPLEHKKELIFYIQTGYAVHPRAVYRFDIQNRRITHRFSTEASFNDILFTDLNGDGRTEIILTSTASGNVHFPAPYKDDRCWLFVLDMELTPIIAPRSFGEFPSALYAKVIFKNNRRFLLLSHAYGGAKAPYLHLYLLDDQWRNVQTKTLSGKPLRNPPFIDKDYSIFFILKQEDYTFYHLSSDLAILNEKTFANLIFPYLIYDLDGDGANELFVWTEGFLCAFDRYLKPVARSNIKVSGVTNFWSVRYNLITGNRELLVTGRNTKFYFDMVRNPVRAYLPLLFIGSWAALFLLMNLGYSLLLMLSIFISFFHHSLRRSPRAILILDERGMIKFANSQASNFLKLAQPIRRNQHFSELLEQGSRTRQILEQALRSRLPVTEKVSFSDKQREFEGEMRVTPATFFLKLFRFCFVEIADLTETMVSERLQVWSKSVQKLAHDIKTPLSWVSLKLYSLQMRLQRGQFPETSQLVEDIEDMRRELERVHQLTRTFLKFIDLENPTFVHFSLLEVIQKAVHRFHQLNLPDLEVIYSVDEEISIIWGDPDQTELVFHVLIENAIDAMQRKGAISLHATLRDCLTEPQQKYVEIEVSDTGPGIATEVRDKIFHPHFSTKAGGSGMGLALARKIVEDHGGSLEIVSGNKSGCTFRITLPYMKNQANQNQLSGA